MRQNLKERLARIGKTGIQKPDDSREKRGIQNKGLWPLWAEAGHNTLKRELSLEIAGWLPRFFSEALAILVPDFLRFGKIPQSENLLFFDLETTGLSGGAGTLAFIAAFGRFASPGSAGEKTSGNAGGKTVLKITQYLLLDYPGELDFIGKVRAEFEPEGVTLPLVVTYNGKSFDSQIFKNRCLMNGLKPPRYFQADLLHPARRLWKKILPDCSQCTIETSVLGLDRSGDVPGALAPEIWFSYLKGGDEKDLLSVCDHNVRDISGLASILLALNEIASNPRGRSFNFDEEALALFWHRTVKKNLRFFAARGSDADCEKTGTLLLEKAAKNGSPCACQILAMDAEWRLKDANLALHYTNLALANSDIKESMREELKKRRIRLEKKCFLLAKKLKS